jgi:Thioesterase-like superfamily
LNSSTRAPHALDLAVGLTSSIKDSYQGQTSPDYANMVGPFGGATAATVLQAVLQHPDRLGEPLSLSLNFAGPIQNGAFVVTTQIVRTNRSTQHWFITLTQDEETAVTATAICAVRRPSWSAGEAICPLVPPADQIERMPPVDWAAWTKQYDMRFVSGGLDGNEQADKGSDNSLSQLWIRDEPPRALDFLSLTAICDVFYPRIFLRRGKLAPAGTVSMMIVFHADAAALAAQGEQAVLGVAQALHFGLSFFDQAAQIWGSNGILLASSHQVVYFKA